MKPIGIIGANGNMGLRYARILDALGVDHVGFDEHDWQECQKYGKDFHSVIVASPTDNHYENLLSLTDFKVLCEKPISKNIDEVVKACEKIKIIRMVNQYEELARESAAGESYYDYFKTGKDGLEWDCLNIIGLAEQKPHVANKSPLWKCQINGKELNLGDMDHAYICMIKKWLTHPTSNKRYILKAHERVHAGWYNA